MQRPEEEEEEEGCNGRVPPHAHMPSLSPQAISTAANLLTQSTQTGTHLEGRRRPEWRQRNRPHQLRRVSKEPQVGPTGFNYNEGFQLQLQ